MKTELNDREKELILRYLAGESSEADRESLEHWRSSAPEHEDIFQQYKKTFELSGLHLGGSNAVESIDVDAEWNAFLQNIDSRRSTTGKHTSTGFRGMWLKIAASLLLIIVAGGIIYQLIRKPTDIELVSYSETVRQTLPDGSVIVLNRRSKVKYASDFGTDNRAVELSGEAYFDVISNTKIPFVIRTSAAEVKVVGTSFTVMAYDSMETIDVTVETGKVKLAAANSADQIELMPGQRGTLIKGNQNITLKTNTDLNYQSWNTRKIVFEETDLETVITTLNRTYNTNILLSVPASTTCVVTVTFDQQTLDAVLHVLESTLNLTIKRSDTSIEIVDAGC